MRIGIIGSGYVGLVTGACFSHLGHEVLCVDSNLQKIKSLRLGKNPIYEPGLEELIRTGLRKKTLRFGTQIKQAVDQCEVLFICVNTPPKENGEADLSYVENVSREIARNLKSYRLIVEKSTVPVQTGEWVHKTIKEIQPRESFFDVASNPEFLREGSAIYDFLNPDRVVIGVSSAKAEKLLRTLYRPLNAKIVVTDIKSAELIKHASNSFLATKISFINGVARVCDAVGADIEKVALGMGLDPRIGAKFLNAGVGFGGSCFPKDLQAFASMSERVGVRFELLPATLALNAEQKKYFVRKIESVLWNLKDKTLAVLGIAFKPDTDDVRSAPSIDIIQQLQEQGCHIRAYDPQAVSKVRGFLKKVKFLKSPYEAMRQADALVILTEWDEFNQLDFKRVKKLLRAPVIFDGRNMLNVAELKKLGFRYCGVGKNA